MHHKFLTQIWPGNPFEKKDDYKVAFKNCYCIDYDKFDDMYPNLIKQLEPIKEQIENLIMTYDRDFDYSKTDSVKKLLEIQDRILKEDDKRNFTTAIKIEEQIGKLLGWFKEADLTATSQVNNTQNNITINVTNTFAAK